MTDTTESLRAALQDSDDFIEAARRDQVIYLTWREAARLLVVKQDALATALERLRMAELAMNRALRALEFVEREGSLGTNMQSSIMHLRVALAREEAHDGERS